MSIGIDFILRAKTEGFKAGMATVNNSLKDVKKSIREFDVGNGLKQALGVGGIIAAFRTAITHAQELRDNLEGIGKPVDDATRSVAELGDAVAKLPQMAAGGLSWFIGGFTQLGELIGSGINRLRGISEATERIAADTAKAAEAAEKRRDEAYRNREKIKADLEKKNDEESSERQQQEYQNEIATWNNKMSIVEAYAKKERERLDTAKSINDAHAESVELQFKELETAKELATVEFMRQKTLAGIAGIRGASQFADASDEALKQLARTNRNRAQAIRGDAGNQGIGQNLEAARLESEAINAEGELRFRNNLRRDFAAGGEAGARARFQGDPLMFDRLLDQYVRGQTVAEETLRVNKDIRDALTKRGIVTVPLTGVYSGPTP